MHLKKSEYSEYQVHKLYPSDTLLDQKVYHFIELAFKKPWYFIPVSTSGQWMKTHDNCCK